MKKKKQQTQQNQSTRQLLGIEGITEYSLKTASSEAVFFSIKPSNISVMSEASLSAKIYSLMSVLKGLTEIEMLCVNSRESFESNKNHLKILSQKEENPAVRKLLEQDMKHLDQIQVILSISLDTIYTKNFSKFSLLPHKYPLRLRSVDICAGASCGGTQRCMITPPFFSRRHAAYCRADSPIVPITHKVTPNKRF